MATGQFFNPPLRHIGRATASGTFVIPASVSKVFVTVTGSRGGSNGGQNGAAGATVSAGGFVEVLPGSTAQLVIGAGAAQPGTAGTTSFDGAITITGSGSGGFDPRYGAYAGGAGVASNASTLPTGSPSGAIARVTGVTSTGPTGDVGTSQSGFINIYA
jgi:hypothetical protein